MAIPRADTFGGILPTRGVALAPLGSALFLSGVSALGLNGIPFSFWKVPRERRPHLPTALCCVWHLCWPYLPFLLTPTSAGKWQLEVRVISGRGPWAWEAPALPFTLCRPEI